LAGNYTVEELKALESFVWEYIRASDGEVSIPPFLIRLSKCDYDWNKLVENLKTSYYKYDYIKYLDIPYEDLPLYINELEGGLKKPIVSWRLHVGR
jgi:hypothetical protein